MRRAVRSDAAGAVATGALAIWLTAIAGCALGPDYRRPEVAAPAAYRFESDGGADSIADAGWWQVYKDPELQSLIRDGLANNLDVRVAAARVDQARAVYGSARLQQLPQVSLNAGAARQRTSLYELPPGIPQVSNVFSLEGSLSYEFDFWGKYRRATESARAQLLQSAYAKEDVMAGLVSSIATAYFTLQSLDEQLAITRRTVGTRQKFVDLTQAQHDRGTVSELDVATAQAQLAIAKANIPELTLLIGQTEDQLSVLLGHNPQALPRNEGAAAAQSLDRAPAPVPAAGLPSSLLERRPDVREAEQNLVAANAQVGVAKANLFPSITLTALGGGVSDALSSLFSGPARTWSAGAGALQPLLSPQRNLYQLELADAQKREALLLYQRSVQTAFQEVSDALLARQQDAEVQAAQEAQVDAQRRANTIALARYRVGYASYFNVIDADRDLFTAELSLSAARLNTLLSVVQLYRALGGGWQVEQPAPASAGSAP
ncbi:MAG TPA: efflux transporter outer membrane subunit [Steroidobacteraceae bacterium]|nr:efflux transporter outer membrane subunit [Steroidobacteraceae bacterium]